MSNSSNISLGQVQLENYRRAMKWKEIYADNSDPFNNDKGIIRFALDLFPHAIVASYGVPGIHHDVYRTLLQLYNPNKTFAQQRQLQLTLFREASKSTITNLIFVSYIICNNGNKIKIADWEDIKDESGKVVSGRLKSLNGIEVTIDENLIVICSETATMAENWVLRLRNEISSNHRLKTVYGVMKPQSLRDEDGKWTASRFKALRSKLPDFQCGADVSIVAKGAGQQFRGMNIDGRPTLIIFDDIYSLRNTVTPEGRQKMRYWVNAEAINTLDRNSGKTVMIGTIVHDDTALVDNQKSPFWQNIEYPAMNIEEFKYILDNYCTINRDLGTMSWPTEDKCKELELKGYKTAWPIKLTLYMLIAKFAENILSRRESMFWQEMFHITIAEDDKIIRQSMMKTRELELVERRINNQWFSFVKVFDPVAKTTEYVHVNLGTGIDGALSYKDSADNSAIMTVGIDFYGRIYVVWNKFGKFSITDEIKKEFEAVNNSTTLCRDINHIQRVGSVDEIFRYYYGTNHRPKIIIETNSVGAEIVRQFRRKMAVYNMRYIVIDFPQTTNKIERILDTLAPYYQSRAVTHNVGQETLKYELEFCGKTKHDDNADVMQAIVANIERPSKLITWEQGVSKEVEAPYKSPKFLGIKPNYKTYEQWRT